MRSNIMNKVRIRIMWAKAEAHPVEVSDFTALLVERHHRNTFYHSASHDSAYSPKSISRQDHGRQNNKDSPSQLSTVILLSRCRVGFCSIVAFSQECRFYLSIQHLPQFGWILLVANTLPKEWSWSHASISDRSKTLCFGALVADCF